MIRGLHERSYLLVERQAKRDTSSSVFMRFGGVTSSSRTLGQETSFSYSVNIFRAFGSPVELFMADSLLLNRLLSSGSFILGKK